MCQQCGVQDQYPHHAVASAKERQLKRLYPGCTVIEACKLKIGDRWAFEGGIYSSILWWDDKVWGVLWEGEAPGPLTQKSFTLDTLVALLPKDSAV